MLSFSRRLHVPRSLSKHAMCGSFLTQLFMFLLVQSRDNGGIKISLLLTYLLKHATETLLSIDLQIKASKINSHPPQLFRTAANDTTRVTQPHNRSRSISLSIMSIPIPRTLVAQHPGRSIPVTTIPRSLLPAPTIVIHEFPTFEPTNRSALCAERPLNSSS